MSSTSESEDEECFIKRNIAVMVVSWALWIPISNAIWIYWQVFLEALNASPAIIALIASLSTISIGFARLLGGYISDRRGRKRIIVTMTYFVGIAYIIMFFAESWQQILIASIILNISLLYQPAMSALLADSMPKETRGRGYAIVWMVPSIFSLTSPIIAYYFASQYGLVEGMRKLFLLMFIVAMFIATLRMIGLVETLGRKTFLEGGIISDYREVVENVFPKMKGLLVYLATINFGFGMTVMLQLYSLRYLKITYDAWAVLMMMNTLIYIILAYPFGWLADRIGRKKLIVLATGMNSLAYIFVASAPNNPLALYYLVVFFIISSTAGAISGSSISAIQADYIPRISRGKTYALIALINAISLSIGQSIGGILYEINPRIPFIITSIIWLTAIILALTIKETLITENKT